MISRRPFDLWESPGDRDLPQGRVSNAWQRQIDADPSLRQVTQVVELVLGNGTRYRMATEVLESTNEFSESRDVSPFLMEEQDVEDNYDVDNGSSGSRSYAVSAPDWHIKSQQQIESGLPIAGFGEVSLLVDGMEWENRRVLIRGDMTGGASFGGHRVNSRTLWGTLAIDQSELFECSIEDPRDSADALFPPAIVDPSTWPTAPDQSTGKVYPVIYGTYTIEGVQITPGASPRFVVAYGHTHAVGSVWRKTGSDDLLVTADFAVIYMSDAKGVPVTVIDYIGATPFGDNEQVLARMEPLSGGDPEVLDVIRDVLLRFHPAGSIMISDRMFGDSIARIGADRRVALVVNTQTTVLSWIEQGLLDDWPMISMAWEDGRYGPIVTDYRREPSQHLVLGDNGQKSGLLRFRLTNVTETPKESLVNDFVFRYRYDARLGTYTGVTSVNPSTTPIAAASDSAVGRRIAQAPIEALSVSLDESAGYITDWVVTHTSLPTYYVEYGCAASLYFSRRRGDSVTLTDPDLRWNQVRATVERLVYQRGMVTIGFRVWQSPLRSLPW